MRLDPLFHWAPARHRDSILQRGLVVMEPIRLQPVEVDASGPGFEVRFPWICLGPTPSAAWGLVLSRDDEHPDSGGSGWDLWQVRLAAQDSVRTLEQWGPLVREVRVCNSIPPDRVWWVGHRDGEPHE